MAKRRPTRKKQSDTPHKNSANSTTSRIVDPANGSGSDDPSPAFPIVGIGASAGGLGALRRLFEAMPDEPGMAFVVIQHLDPTKKSLTAELLANQTAMQVTQVEDDPRVAANRVYVIPPDKYLSISNGVLHLSPPDKPRGTRMAVDYFLRSLAQDHQQRAVGIILSGTGTDGTLGAKAIKQHGGLVIAQDPPTAEYDGMPRSAIETGAVDHVLAPEKMPEVLTRYATHSYVREPSPSLDEEGHLEPQEGLEAVIALVRAHGKHDFRNYKDKTLIRRTRRRMCLHHIDEYQQYLWFLREHPGEIDALIKDLLISVTDFFRDGDAWDELQRQVIAPLVQAKGNDQPIRVWVPGCATGEEPYSVAMLFLEELGRQGKQCPLQVFASDIDKQALEYARAGRYPRSIEADVPPERLKRFFQDENTDHYRVCKTLRESVVFADQNLIADPPFSRLDLICCRNLLIYLKSEVQDKIISLFHFALLPGGFLFLGSSETIGRHHDLFQTLGKQWRIYRRLGAERHEDLEFPIVPGTSRRELERTPAPARRETRLTHLAQQRLLDLLAPSAVLIDREWRILYICGDVDAYLTHTPGMPTDDLLTKARRGLRTKLRAAVHRALSDQQIVSATARVYRDGHWYPVALTLRPIKDREQREDLVLVVFDERRGEEKPVQSGGSGVEAPRDSGRERRHEDQFDDHSIIRQLEDELAVTKEDLQTTIEQLETSNEEYKAANEEVMSINEELQSTNEELETSKEELQSLNEELSTVNHQLAAKLEELETKHNDLVNLLAATDVATVCLDRQLRIRWFTPAAMKLIRLTDADLGRPLADLAHDFVNTDLLPVVEEVLRRLVPIEDETRCRDGRTLLRRVVPYRTEGDRIAGVMLTFIDISQRIGMEAKLREANESLEQQVAERTEMLRILQDVTRSANEALSVEEALRAALQHIAAYDGWKLGHVYRLAESGDRQMVSAEIWYTAEDARFPADRLAAFQKATRQTQFAPGQGMVGAVWQTGQPQWLDDLKKAGDQRQREAERLGLKSAIAFPVPADSEVVAVIEYYSEHATKRETRFLDIMPEVGMQLGHVIERKRLERGIAEAITEQQRHFGRELHDSVAQQLTGLGMLAQTLQRQLAQKAPELADQVATLNEQLQVTRQQVGRLSRGLMPVDVDAQGLLAALEQLANNTQTFYGLPSDLEVDRSIQIHDNSTATHLYHIAQEAIHNAAKHGQPNQARIRLARQDGGIVLTIEDDGCGFDPAEARTGSGHRIMRYRAGLIGATLDIRSAPGQGAAVRLVLPGS